MAATDRILITGICGNLGRTVARRMHRDHHIVGVDRRPFHNAPKDIEHHRLDLRRKAAENLFRKRNIHTVIHLNILHNPRAYLNEHYTFNLYGTTKLLDYCAKYGVKKFIFLSSANIYGPRPESSGYLSEAGPLMASQGFGGIQDLIAVDLLVQSFFWKQPELEVVILRPVHIVGPGIKNAPTNYLRLDPIITLLGFDPLIQLVHSTDVVNAIHGVLSTSTRGIYNVGGPGVIPLSQILERLGRRTLPVPRTAFKAMLQLLWKTRLTSFPPPELAHLQYNCLVDDTRIRDECGYAPGMSYPDMLDELNTY